MEVYRIELKSGKHFDVTKFIAKAIIYDMVRGVESMEHSVLWTDKDCLDEFMLLAKKDISAIYPLDFEEYNRYEALKRPEATG